MKVSIIGGGGRVGSNAAYVLQIGGLVREIALVDSALERAHGEALDLRHGASLAAFQKIYSGGLEVIDGSDIVIISAGTSRKPGESRLELANCNAILFRGILDDLKNVKMQPHAVILVVTNPVDIMTHVAANAKIVPPNRVIGLGTLIDTARFRSLLAELFEVDPTSVDALILGEHGDSMVPILSAATIQGIPLKDFPSYNKSGIEGVIEQTKSGGTEAIRLKGGACHAVGLAIRELVNAIVLDSRAALPVSTLQQGAYGIDGVCLSLPTVIGREGALGVPEITITSEESEALRKSAVVLKNKIAQLS